MIPFPPLGVLRVLYPTCILMGGVAEGSALAVTFDCFVERFLTHRRSPTLYGTRYPFEERCKFSH